MQLKGLLLIVSSMILLSSCMVDNSQEIEQLRQEVSSLKAKVDSLELDFAVRPNQKSLNGKMGLPKTRRAKSTTAMSVGEISTNTSSTQDDGVGTTEKTFKASYSRRCQATTKKGSQCLRNARSGGYCWQHGG